MAQRRSEYNQLGIGDCGHVVHTWPQVTALGGRNPRVICEDCTRAEHGIPDGEPMIWVKLSDKKIGYPKAKPAPRKRTPKPKRVSTWDNFMKQEGLF